MRTLSLVLAFAIVLPAAAGDVKTYKIAFDLRNPPVVGAKVGGATVTKFNASGEDRDGEFRFEDGWYFCKVKHAALRTRAPRAALNLVGGTDQDAKAGVVSFYALLPAEGGLHPEVEVVAVRKDQRATSACWPDAARMPIIECASNGPCTEPWKTH